MAQRRMWQAVMAAGLAVTLIGAPTTAARAAGINDSCPTGQVPEDGFADANTSSHESAIDCVVWWVVANGVSSTAYAPAANVTRAQMASFIARAITQARGFLPSSPPNAFTDDEGSPHELSINKLAAQGVVGGKGGGLYAPNELVTRGQMAKFLVAAYEYRSGGNLTWSQDHFSDDNESVFEDFINAAAEAGLASGTSATTYEPDRTVRRDQMASFLARLLDLWVEDGLADPVRGTQEIDDNAVADETVSIVTTSFGGTVTITEGEAVAWENDDDVSHTVSALDEAFEEPTLSVSERYVVRFTVAGTFNYQCEIHPGMDGTVTVS